MVRFVKTVLVAAALSASFAGSFAALAEDAPAPKTEAKADAPKSEKKEIKNGYMVKVEGMMCAACEAKVKKALEGVEGVKKVKACHKAGAACVEMEDKKELTKDAAEKALAGLKDFKVTGVEKCEAGKCGKKGECKDGKCDGKNAKACHKKGAKADDKKEECTECDKDGDKKDAKKEEKKD